PPEPVRAGNIACRFASADVGDGGAGIELQALNPGAVRIESDLVTGILSRRNGAVFVDADGRRLGDWCAGLDIEGDDRSARQLLHGAFGVLDGGHQDRLDTESVQKVESFVVGALGPEIVAQQLW